jgi:hypothetical protein
MRPSLPTLTTVRTLNTYGHHGHRGAGRSTNRCFFFAKFHAACGVMPISRRCLGRLWGRNCSSSGLAGSIARIRSAANSAGSRFRQN